MDGKVLFNHIAAIAAGAIFFLAGLVISIGGYEEGDCFYPDGTLKRYGTMCLLMRIMDKNAGSAGLGILLLTIGVSVVCYHMYQIIQKNKS